MADMDIIAEQKIYWEKVGEILSGKRVTIKVDNNIIFDKTVPAEKYLNGRIQVIGTLINNGDRPVDED